MADKLRTYEDYHPEDLFTYAGIDNIVTSNLLHSLWPTITATPNYQTILGHREGSSGLILQNRKAPSILSEALGVKAKALDFMIDMEVNGLRYDVDANIQMDADMRADILELEEKLIPITGDINFDSDAELSKLLYVTKGFTPSIFTKSGAPSASGDALKLLKKEHGHEWLDWLAKRNDISSVHSSFVATYVEDWVKRDGRVHPNYNLHGTSSHRISSDRPNLLNIPNKTHGYNLRDLFIVKLGNVFLTFDFSSCEVKVLAALCKDETMLKAILAGLDFHSYTASLMYNIPYDDIVEAVGNEEHPEHGKFKKMRQGAKAVTFGILFGSSLYAIAAGLGITNEEAQVIVDAYFKTYPKIKEFVDQAHYEAKTNQFVVSPFGQRKMEFGTLPCYKYSAVHNAALRNAQNVKIQGPASTLGLMSFAHLNSKVKKMGGITTCTVYDSVEQEIPIRKLAEAIENGFYCMDDWPQKEFDWLDFPIGADAEIGFSWGNLTTVKRGITQEEIEAKLKAMDPAKFKLTMAA